MQYKQNNLTDNFNKSRLVLVIGVLLSLGMLVAFFFIFQSKEIIAQVNTDPCEGGVSGLGGPQIPDLNSDGCVDEADVSVLLSCWGFTLANAPSSCRDQTILFQYQCSDGVDNDGDGQIDLADPGCSSANDNNETNTTTPTYQCSDGVDNDGDGQIDLADPGCSSANDNDESNSIVVAFQCSDELDNDGDGQVDLADPGCSSPNDNDETNIVVPPITPSAGLWLSPSEIAALPMSGAAWSAVLSAANSSWGSACLYDNNCMHDVNTLAGALVAARTGDSAMRTKVIEGLVSATQSSLARALELARGMQSYVIAADIIGYSDPSFDQWIRNMINANITGHTCPGILGTAKCAANNWGGHARASLTAAALYLNDQALLADMVAAHKAFIGLNVQSEMQYTSTNWHADPSNQAGVNRLGATISGQNVSGVLPEDWRRAAEYQWPPAFSGYMWEGMQGFVVTAVLLHRAGEVSIHDGDDAVKRTMDILFAIGYPPEDGGDDAWITWLVNHYVGTNYQTSSSGRTGKGMGWTDWTHAN